jgi:hypothetical protein
VGLTEMSMGEHENLRRAEGLRRCFNTEELAKFMHQNYRAAFKALHFGRGTFMGVGRVGKPRVTASGMIGCKNEHDHSYESCHKKQYFLNRAARILWPKER